MSFKVSAPTSTPKLTSLGLGGLFILNLSLAIGSTLFIGVFAIMLVPMATDPSSPFLIQTTVKLIFLIPVVAILGLLFCVLGLLVKAEGLKVVATLPFLYSLFALIAFMTSLGVTFILHKLNS